MIVTKVLCDNCGKEIEGKPFVTMHVGYSGECHYCFECSKVLLDAWNAAATQSQIDMGLRKPEKRSAEQEALAAEKVEIRWIVDFLARNGVQWPYASKDVADEAMLREMWKYILESHWRKVRG